MEQAEQKDPSARSHDPLQIDPREEQHLSNFFCSWNTAAHRSNFGAMVERLDRFGHRADPCPARCEKGIDLETGELCTTCQGDGLDKPERIGGGIDPNAISATDPCPRCHGRTGRDDCVECGGDGYVAAMVQTGSPGISGEHYEPNVVTTQHAGRIASGLAHLRETDPVMADALELFYGPIGNRWGATDAGRLFAVLPITKPGRKIIDDSREKSESQHTLEIGAHDLLFEEKENERRASVPNARRRALLSEAEKSATHLLERARRAWVLLASGGR